MEKIINNKDISFETLACLLCCGTKEPDTIVCVTDVKQKCHEYFFVKCNQSGYAEVSSNGMCYRRYKTAITDGNGDIIARLCFNGNKMTYAIRMDKDYMYARCKGNSIVLFSDVGNMFGIYCTAKKKYIENEL